MKVVDILQEIKSNAGSNAKKAILESHKDNELLKKVLRYGSDPFTPFNIVKVPKTENRYEADKDSDRWNAFFSVADMCAERTYTGNFAIQMMSDVFTIASEEEEKWMRIFSENRYLKCKGDRDVRRMKVYKVCRWPGVCPYQDNSITDDGMYNCRVQINLNNGKKRKFLYFQTDYKIRK